WPAQVVPRASYQERMASLQIRVGGHPPDLPTAGLTRPCSFGLQENPNHVDLVSPVVAVQEVVNPDSSDTTPDPASAGTAGRPSGPRHLHLERKRQQPME